MRDESNKIYTIDEIKEISKPVFDRQEYDFVDKAYLFGSYARNEAKENSDVDFMITLNRKALLEFYGLYQDLKDVLYKNVDVIREEEAMKIMPKSIERDKVLIYERKNI